MNETPPRGVLALIAKLETRLAAVEKALAGLTRHDLQRFREAARPKDDGS